MYIYIHTHLLYDTKEQTRYPKSLLHLADIKELATHTTYTHVHIPPCTALTHVLQPYVDT